MEILVALAGGMILLGILLMLGDSSNSKLEQKLKGKNVSMPDLGLMFGSKKRKR